MYAFTFLYWDLQISLLSAQLSCCPSSNSHVKDLPSCTRYFHLSVSFKVRYVYHSPLYQARIMLAIVRGISSVREGWPCQDSPSIFPLGPLKWSRPFDPMRLYLLYHHLWCGCLIYYPRFKYVWPIQPRAAFCPCLVSVYLKGYNIFHLRDGIKFYIIQ